MGAKGVGECFLGSTTGMAAKDRAKWLASWRTVMKEGGGECDKESSKVSKDS